MLQIAFFSGVKKRAAENRNKESQNKSTNRKIEVSLRKKNISSMRYIKENAHPKAQFYIERGDEKDNATRIKLKLLNVNLRFKALHSSISPLPDVQYFLSAADGMHKRDVVTSVHCHKQICWILDLSISS